MFSLETFLLVVDDSANIRKIMAESLNKIGFTNVTLAENTTEAWEKLKAVQYTPRAIGLILSDLMMPGPNGLDFLKKVRNERDLRDLPFILVTTESEKDIILASASAGVSSYIVKPFNPETLLKKIENAWVKHNPPIVA